VGNFPFNGGCGVQLLKSSSCYAVGIGGRWHGDHMKVLDCVDYSHVVMLLDTALGFQ